MPLMIEMSIALIKEVFPLMNLTAKYSGREESMKAIRMISTITINDSVNIKTKKLSYFIRLMALEAINLNTLISKTTMG